MPTKGCAKLECEKINLLNYNRSICKSISSSHSVALILPWQRQQQAAVDTWTDVL